VVIEDGANLTVAGRVDIGTTTLTIGRNAWLNAAGTTVTAGATTLDNNAYIRSAGTVTATGTTTLASGAKIIARDIITLAATTNLTGGNVWFNSNPASGSEGVGQGTLTFSTGATINSNGSSKNVINVGTLNLGNTLVFGATSTTDLHINATTINNNRGNNDLSFTNNITADEGATYKTLTLGQTNGTINVHNLGQTQNRSIAFGGAGNIEVRSNIVDGTIAGVAGLSKSGTGILTLTGSNTYSGATAVTAGTLIVNGSITGSGLTVSDSAKLGGKGTIHAATTLNNNGILLAGKLTFTNGLTLRSGTSGQQRYINVAGGDMVTIAGGNLNWGDNVGRRIKITLEGTSWKFGDGYSYLLFDLDDADDFNTNITLSLSGKVDFTDLLLDSDALAAHNASGMTDDIWLYYYNGIDDGEIHFNPYSLTTRGLYIMGVIPEPSTWLLLGAGAAFLVIFRRRKA